MKRALGNVLPHIAFFATIFMHVSDRKGGEGGMLVRTSEIFIKPSLHALNQVFSKRCKKIMKVIYKDATIYIEITCIMLKFIKHLSSH